MERLTEKERNEDGSGISKLDVTTVDDSLTKAGRDILTKLATYEDLEEQGLLVRLPCKVGDLVYAPTRNFISEFRITMVSINKHGTLYFSWVLDDDNGIYPNLDGFSSYELGKTVFLTREEAEKKLKELKNGEQNC